MILRRGECVTEERTVIPRRGQYDTDVRTV